MATLYLDEHSTIRKFTSAGTGTRTIVKVEIEVTDPYSLGSLLRELGDEQQKRAAARKAADDAARTEKTHARKLAKPAKMLALPYFGGDQS